jgi:hypothetical protein
VKTKNLTFTALAIVALILVSLPLLVKTVKAQNPDYVIDHVDQVISLMHNGYVFINDTIQMNGTAPDGFQIGFPAKYGAHVLRCMAYNSTDNFDVNLNVPLNNSFGFFGVEIDFPQGTPQTFNVGFVLSNSLLSQNAQNVSVFTLDFPAFPSLTRTATTCNSSIAIKNAEYISGTVEAFNYTFANGALPAFTYQPANVTFQLAGSGVQLFEVKELKREIRINGAGEIEGADNYFITSKAPVSISSFEVALPLNASKISAQDQFGRKLATPTLADAKTNLYRITLLSTLESYKSTRFTVKYSLPATIYSKQKSASQFDSSFPLFQNLNCYVGQASVSLVLPEGAKIIAQNTSAVGNYGIVKGIFQETVTISKQGMISLDKGAIEITYEYNLLWLSFRTTLWMWALTIVGCAVVVVARRPKATVAVALPKVAVSFSPEKIRSFVDSYEEKRKLTAEIKSLEAGVRKGKIPRRRYKVQKKISETRLETLDRGLMDSKQRLRAMGGRYADLMHQLEVAETEINEVEANIVSIEARHRRGDLSLEAYRKLLADYERRREKAETTISGILIRLREEIR